MKSLRIIFGVVLILVFFSSVSVAGDFDWFPDFNIKAEADPSGFRARLATRFQVGNAQINAVISNTNKPADAYMILRLGEMSNRPPEYVVKQYKEGKGKGWGVLAKSLGIRPGSPEFHALKKGQDLYVDGQGKGRGKGKGKGKYKE